MIIILCIYLFFVCLDSNPLNVWTNKCESGVSAYNFSFVCNSFFPLLTGGCSEGLGAFCFSLIPVAPVAQK